MGTIAPCKFPTRSPPSMILRDALLESLKGLPGKREFHLHVLVSSPRRHSSLFPFAHPRPKVYLQDVLVLLSEQRKGEQDEPRVMVTAIEASVYVLPATSCAIVHVSKVDSTGQATAPSPTSTLVRALLLYYADPSTRPVRADHVWIHLFARAQGQYLFPNSSEYPGKRPLSDVKLCAWWLRTLGTAVRVLCEREELEGKIRTKMYYVLPGCTEHEASHSLNFALGVATTEFGEWIYGHPYSQKEIPLPCIPADASGDPHQSWHLGHYIPSFDDDPKNRFMDEIAYTTDANGIRSPRKKKRKRTIKAEATSAGTNDADDELPSLGSSGKSKSDRAPPPPPPPPAYGDLANVTADEFWERMSFRQECIAGIITGFFAVGITCTPLTEPIPSCTSPSASEPQLGQVPSSLTKRIMTDLLTGHEFSTRERAMRATEALEKTIKGLCEGLAPTPLPAAAKSTFPVAGNASGASDDQAILAPPSTPPRRENGADLESNVRLNPFPEPVASLETYRSYIYGSLRVENPPLEKFHRGTAAMSTAEAGSIDGVNVGVGVGVDSLSSTVTVLTARKKKKRGES
jgi:regulator of Ty1 transposition protein 109